MSNFTPGLDQLRSSYVARWYEQTVKQSKAEFDRAIAKVRADAKVEALREATEAWWVEADSGKQYDAWRWLKARADNLEAS